MAVDIREPLVELLPRLRRFAVGLTGNANDADDLLQQACEKALRKQHQWTTGTRLDSWMFRIIQTTRIDQIRSQRTDVDSLDDTELSEIEDEQNESASENHYLLHQVSNVWGRLPQDQRAVMLLIAVEGYSYDEVSKMLNIPTGTVMSRLYRARMSVRSELGTDVFTVEKAR